MPREPASTYRLQLHGGFRLVDAQQLVPYLHRLGISDLYLSPLHMARPGSLHGYDGVDPRRLNPELGTEADLEGLAVALRQHRMGALLDIVPNHMAACFANPWWRDLLEHGAASRSATFFDVDWHAEPTLTDKVLVPVLGRPYGEALEAAELRIEREGGRLIIRYFEHQFPVQPSSWEAVLAQVEGLEPSEAIAGFVEQVLEAARNIPPARARSRGAISRRKRAARKLREIVVAGAADPEIAAFVDDRLSRIQGKAGDPRSFDALDALLLNQHYRLVYWRSGYERLNYRRFFNINELIGVRVENEPVMDATHEWWLRLIQNGRMTGFRVDHIDGLLDPAGYLHRLQRRFREVTGDHGYILVEKILASDERLPEDWPVSGTTGYEFVAALNGLFVEPAGLDALDRLYERHTGRATDWSALVF